MVTLAAGTFDTSIEERDDPRVLWPMIVLFWIVNLAMTTAQVYVNARSTGVYPPLFDVLGFMVQGFVVWLLSVPLVVFILTRGRSFPRHLPRRHLQHPTHHPPVPGERAHEGILAHRRRCLEPHPHRFPRIREPSGRDDIGPTRHIAALRAIR